MSQSTPPNIHVKEENVNLDITITPSVVKVNHGEVTKLPTCSDLICTLEFIPEHCRLIPVLERNGLKCSGCWQWKDSCKGKSTNQTLTPNVTCPVLTCSNRTIPKKCLHTETYEYMGKMCEKCPVHVVGCMPDSSSYQEKEPCPVHACTLQLIPDECREITTFKHNGIMCKGCPKWKQGCKQILSQHNTLQKPLLPRVSCPQLVCDTYIPQECREEREFQYRGRMCMQCPRWREGCREQDRLNTLNFNKGETLPLNEPCPKFPCSDKDIPTECKIVQPFEFRGRTCFKCPIRNPNCNVVETGSRNTPKLPSCPLVKCERPAHIPQDCYQREFINYKGNICESCPSVKRECQQFVHPRPNVQIFPGLAGSKGIQKIPCPLLQCKILEIQPDCIENQFYQYEGKMCQGCPKARDGCVSSMIDQKQLSASTGFPNIPERNPNITQCPVKACPMVYIPEECKEEQPYKFHGKTCYDCPKQKENCVKAQSEIPEHLQQRQCPMFGCPMIYIPEECRVERPFIFQGKTCYMCPEWRKGCVPLPQKPNVNSLIQSTERLTTIGRTTTGPPKPNIPETSCPLMRCTKIFIPPNCREEQPYDYNGKACYKCPKWRDSCLGKTEQYITTTSTPNNPLNTTKVLEANDRTSITDLKEIIPVSKIVNTVSAATCPQLKCPSMYIPFNCREESFYRYQERTCKGCPRWRLGCYPMSGAEMNMNANG